MLGCLGDVIHDVVVRLGGPIQRAADTPSVIVHRRGGSAANVAVAAARLTGRARFIGQVGADADSVWLRQTLADAGVEFVGHVGGRTGTVVSVVDESAERSMLTDRGSAGELTDPEPQWLDGLTALHVPMYAFGTEPLATTARTLLGWAAARGLIRSLDVSSTTLVDQLGRSATRALIEAIGPTVVLLNAEEAKALGDPIDAESLAVEVVAIKQGAGPTIVRWRGGEAAVDVAALAGVHDTTGAGDAFAAGFLVEALRGGSWPAAAAAGHESAAVAIRAASAEIRPDR